MPSNGLDTEKVENRIYGSEFSLQQTVEYGAHNYPGEEIGEKEDGACYFPVRFIFDFIE